MDKFEMIDKQMRVLKLAYQEGLLHKHDLRSLESRINDLFAKLSQPQVKNKDYSGLLEQYGLDEEDLADYDM